jgi:hypothetical protein
MSNHLTDQKPRSAVEKRDSVFITGGDDGRLLCTKTKYTTNIWLRAESSVAAEAVYGAMKAYIETKDGEWLLKQLIERGEAQMQKTKP